MLAQELLCKGQDKGNISRLRKSLDSSNKLSPPGPIASFQSLALRSKTLSTDWKLCMFCRDEETPKKQTLCSVTTFKMNQQILEGVRCDHDLSLRVAAEGRYHPNCYKKFQRKMSQSGMVAKDESGAVLLWLIEELKKSAEQGNILELKEVWLRFCSLAAE